MSYIKFSYGSKGLLPAASVALPLDALAFYRAQTLLG